MRTFLAVTLTLVLAAVTAGAATISLDFESETANSATVPTGWALQSTPGGTAVYRTTPAGQGSNGLGGNTGLAGQISCTAGPSNTQYPGAYLASTTNVDLTKAFSGTFDFRIVHESTYDDVGFLLGAVGDGLNVTGGSAGEFVYAKFTEGGGGKLLKDGLIGDLDAVNASLVDDTWYHAVVAWTPTSGTTGDFSITVSDFSSDVFSLSTTGFTFDSAEGQIGFGSVNDTMRVDNVSFTPEPASLTLLAIGGLLAIRRRRRA